MISSGRLHVVCVLQQWMLDRNVPQRTPGQWALDSWTLKPTRQHSTRGTCAAVLPKCLLPRLPISKVVPPSININMDDLLDRNRAEAFASYADKHELFDLFESIVSRLLIERPEDVIQFIIDQLQKPKSMVRFA